MPDNGLIYDSKTRKSLAPVDAAKRYREFMSQNDPNHPSLQLGDEEIVNNLVRKYPQRYIFIKPGETTQPPGAAVGAAMGLTPEEPPSWLTPQGIGKGALSLIPDAAATVASFIPGPQQPVGLGAKALWLATRPGVREGIAATAGSLLQQGGESAMGDRPMPTLTEAVKEGGIQGLMALGGELASVPFRGVFRAGSELPENIAVKQTSEKYGLNIPGPHMARGSKAGDIGESLQFVGESSLFGSKMAEERRRSSLEAGAKAVQSELGGITPRTFRRDVSGRIAQRGVKSGEQAFRKEAGRLYEQFDNLAPDVWVNTQDIKDMALVLLDQEKRIVERGGKSAGLSANARKLIKDMTNLGEPGMSSIKLSDLKDIRSRLMKYGPDINAVDANQAEGLAKKFTGAINDAIGEAAKTGDRKAVAAVDAWKKANRFYSEGMGIFSGSNVSKFATMDIPEQVFGLIKQNPSQAMAVRIAMLEYPMKYGTPAEKALARRRYQIFKDQYVRSEILGGLPIPKQAPDQAMEGLLLMKKRMDDIGMDTLGEVFGPGGQSELKRLYDLANAFTRIGGIPGVRTQSMYGLMGSVDTMLGKVFEMSTNAMSKGSGSGSLLRYTVLPSVLAYAVKNPKLNDALINGIRFTEQGKAVAAKKAFNRLAEGLADDRAFASGLRAYVASGEFMDKASEPPSQQFSEPPTIRIGPASRRGEYLPERNQLDPFGAVIPHARNR